MSCSCCLGVTQYYVMWSHQSDCVYNKVPIPETITCVAFLFEPAQKVKSSTLLAEVGYWGRTVLLLLTWLANECQFTQEVQLWISLVEIQCILAGTVTNVTENDFERTSCRPPRICPCCVMSVSAINFCHTTIKCQTPRQYIVEVNRLV